MVTTAGNILVQDIRIGDIHYEFHDGFGVKCQVINMPIKDLDNNWTWESKNLKSGRIIHFFVNENHPQFAPKLYDYEAYIVKEWI